MELSIGYIGLGAMGGALARRLAASWPLQVWDINARAASAFVELGATVPPSCEELARRCNVILLCLPRSSDVRQLLLGPGGMLAGLSRGTVLIDQTSGMPEETRAIAHELEAHGVRMLDAPVAGGVAAAAAGRITMMVSGPDAVLETVKPVLEAISPTIVRCGTRLGDGQAAKAINNMMNAACRLATLEATALGHKLGLPVPDMTAAINASGGRSRISLVALPALAEGRPSSDFSLPLMVKDVDQALRLGASAGSGLPLGSLTRSFLQAGVGLLGPDSRLEEMIGLVARMAGTRFGAAPAGSPQEGALRAVVAAVTACNLAIAREALAMAGRIGLGEQQFRAAIQSGSGWSSAFDHAAGQPVAEVDFPAILPQLVQELQLACDLASEAGAPLLFANLVRSALAEILWKD
jgi:3-hydroxyisobutyrate dehydrogenase